jgi:hypothetical protein
MPPKRPPPDLPPPNAAHNTDDTDDTDDADDDTDASPEGNITRAKRDLIKLGLSQGYITAEQLQSALPLAHMSDAELETLFFTFSTLGIRAPKPDQP